MCVCKRKGKKQRGRNGDIVLEATTQVIRNELEKEKKKGNVWMKERKRMRNDHLKILLQYFHNKF